MRLVNTIIVMSICALWTIDSLATELVLEVHKAEDKQVMYSRVGEIADNGFIDWGNVSKIAKASSLGVGFDGKKLAVLVYGDDDDEKKFLYRVGHVDSESLTISWGASEPIGIKGRSPGVTIRGNRVILSLKGSSKDNLYVVTGVIQGERKQVVWGNTQIFDEKGSSVDID